MKTVLITGAAKGIGAACALAFAREGYAVAVHYHNSRTQAEALCAELSAMGADAAAFCADLTDRSAIADLFAAVYDRFGTIDVLVNNAGIALVKLFTDTSDDEWDRMIASDLTAAALCSRAVLPDMIRRHSGCIVNIASMWGEVGASCEVAYSAAKAGLIGLTKALAKEVAPSGIRVNAVSPGVIMTDMMAGFSDDDLAALKDEIPLGTLGAPGDVADAVIFLSSERARYITGQVLSVNGGFVIS
jgi:3-oxoacyl-[acyl-carrier protein] reductase